MKKFLEDVRLHLVDYYDQIVALLPKVILAALIMVIGIFVAGRLRRFARTQLNHHMEDPLLAQFFARMARWIILIIGFLIVLKVLGLGNAAASLMAGAGITAFVIGFAFKDIGENFLAGILMAFKRPFRIGDIVETEGITGTIIGLTLRDTQIKTFDGKDVYVPNGQIMKNPIINYTIDGFLRLDFTVGLDYGSDLTKASKLIYETLKKVSGVLWKENKKPEVRITELGSSTVNLTVFFWIDTFDKTTTQFVIETNAVQVVLQALAGEGYYMPAEIMEVKVYNDKPFSTVQQLSNSDPAA